MELGNELYLICFQALSGDRPMSGMGPPGRIPWATIQDWCDRNGVHGLQREEVVAVIQSADLAYLEYLREKTPKPGDKTT